MDKKTINTICGFCLEFVIVSAVATIQLDLVAAYIIPILIMSVCIISMTVVFSILCSKLICKDDWFEKGIGSYGQSNGSASTGLALIRCVDPNGETSAADAVGIANSVTSPLYSSMAAFGPVLLLSSMWAFVGIGALLLTIPLGIGVFIFGKK